MKKSFYFLAAGALALSACTSEEVLDVSTTQSNVIGFTNVVNKVTREGISGDLTNKMFDNFLVYGYYIKPGMATPIQIFNGVPVHKDIVDGEEKWSYDSKRYWVPGCTYFFYAYSCGDVALASGKGSPVFSLFDATVKDKDNRALTLSGYLCDSNHQHDLVTAEREEYTAKESDNPAVSLSFSHALCKVKAVFTTDFASEYKVYVSNVYLTSFFNQADFNVGTGGWSGHTITNSPYVMLNIPDTEAKYVSNSTGSSITTSDVFLIPKLYDNGKSENAQIHFTIEIKKEVEKDGKVTEETILERNVVGTWSPQWVKGTIFQYSINISGSTVGIEPIVFETNQDLEGAAGWAESTQVNMVFGVDANTTQASENE